MTLNNPTGRTATGVTRSQALAHYYAAERNAGTPALIANERLHFFAKRLDKLHADCRLSSDEKFASDLAIIRKCMESKP